MVESLEIVLYFKLWVVCVEADIYYIFGCGGKSLFTASLILCDIEVGLTYFEDCVIPYD